MAIQPRTIGAKYAREKKILCPVPNRQGQGHRTEEVMTKKDTPFGHLSDSKKVGLHSVDGNLHRI